VKLAKSKKEVILLNSDMELDSIEAWFREQAKIYFCSRKKLRTNRYGDLPMAVFRKSSHYGVRIYYDDDCEGSRKRIYIDQDNCRNRELSTLFALSFYNV
jgi:hypothetical protein